MNEWIPVISSIVALTSSLFALFVSTRLATKKERRQIRWSKEMDRLFCVEEEAGFLFDILTSQRQLPGNIRLRLGSFVASIGRYARYPALQSRLHDLHNTLARLNDSREFHRDDIDILKIEATKVHSNTLAEIDSILEK